MGLPEEDYLLGVLDLGGEMMRGAIVGMAVGGERGEVGKGRSEGEGGRRTVVQDLRELRVGMEGLRMGEGGMGREREWERKMEVMRTCVEKVEGAVYGMIVRGRERPTGWVPEEAGTVERRAEGVEGY